MIAIIVTRRDNLKNVCNVYVLCSTECDTNHKLVHGIFKLQTRTKIWLVDAKFLKCINLARLRQFSDTFSNIIFDSFWEKFKNQVYLTSVDILGLNDQKQRLV